MSRPDGYEQRTFAAQEAAERYDAETERLEDEADTDDGGFDVWEAFA